MEMRILLLIPATSYRAGDFLDAARQLGVEVIVGSNHRPVLDAFSCGRTVTLDFTLIADGVSQIVAHVRQYPVAAIVGTDEETIVLAATASKALGLAHNSPDSVTAAHDKYRFRSVLAQAGIRSPWFRLISLQEDLTAAAAQSATYPCILKPLSLSASRGVIRADDAAGFVAACRRITAILQNTKGLASGPEADSILVEGFIPGREVALEGLLNKERLQVLALFDKPDPLDGPFFEETLYVTPSRLPDSLQHAIAAETAEATRALGLKEGPVHAELRINEQGVWIIELAARSIGGLCSRSLIFTQGTTLEALIVRHALGLSTSDLKRETQATGVMMIPIPKAGQLRAVTGLEAARRITGIEEVIISIPLGEYLMPLPEGDRYLGFIFARADEPDEVESALRKAHQQIYFEI